MGGRMELRAYILHLGTHELSFLGSQSGGIEVGYTFFVRVSEDHGAGSRGGSLICPAVAR